MGSILDIISSTVIGGVVILMMLTALDTAHKYFYAHTDDLIVQQNLASISATLEYDLKKMGFAIPETENIVLIADSTHLRYRGDVNRDFLPDTVEYYAGPVSELTSTKNPNDRFLYRKINSLPAGGFIVGVVTAFKFDYLDQDGIPVVTSNPADLIAVKMIRITMKVENPAVYGSNPNPTQDEYRTAFWQQTRLVSRNLRR